MEAKHPYSSNDKYEFNAAYDDSTLLDERTVMKGKKSVREAIVYDIFDEKNGVNINRKNFCDGFRLLFVKLNQRCRTIQPNHFVDLTIDRFRATAFDFVKVLNNEQEMEDALFPVDFESIGPVMIKNKPYKVTINMDNPTALAGHNMDAGPQGTHFGYSIKSLADEFIGHVLINTFVGFPTRDKKALDSINSRLPDHPKRFRNTELINILANVNYVMPYDLIRTNSLSEALQGHPITSEPAYPVLDTYWL